MSGDSDAARKGLLGGMFNPPHIAHLIVAHVVREALGLDGVLFVPASIHAFKGAAEATAVQRATMVELAVAGDRALGVDRIEIERGGTSYTADTLVSLREREPATRWHLILGQDNLHELPEWKLAERLPELAEVVVITRGTEPGAAHLPYDGQCTFVPVPSLDISSTAVRERVAGGRSIRYWVPPAVEAFIRENGLYRGPDGEGH